MPMPYGAMSRVKIEPALYKLKIELVPEKSWGNNLRALLTDHQWKKVREDVYKKAQYECVICGASSPGRRHKVECHERWHYDDKQCIQTLVDLEALCTLCHKTKHIGFAEKSGKLDDCIAQLCKVNNITSTQAKEYILWAYEQQKKRSAIRWQLNLTWFNEKYPQFFENK